MKKFIKSFWRLILYWILVLTCIIVSHVYSFLPTIIVGYVAAVGLGIMTLCSVYFITQFMIVTVQGTSMEPVLHDGDIRIVANLKHKSDKYKKQLLERGDIVVIDTKDYQITPNDSRVVQPFNSDKELFIKRLCIIGNGSIRCSKGTIWVNDSSTHGAWKPWGSVDHYAPNYTFSEYYVKDDEIFFVGDHLHLSTDSRFREKKSHLNCLYKVKDIIGVDLTDKMPPKFINKIIKMVNKDKKAN